MGFYMKGKGDGCHQGSMFGMGEIQVKCIFGIQGFGLIWRIWNDFRCTWNEGFLQGCSHINFVTIFGATSTLGTRDESPSKPKTPINMETWELEIGPMVTRGEACKM